MNFFSYFGVSKEYVDKLDKGVDVVNMFIMIAFSRNLMANSWYKVLRNFLYI